MLSFYIVCLLVGLPFGAQGSLNSNGCSRDEFSCSNGQCIYLNQWCDSVVDCKDGLDEKYCKKKNEQDPNPNKCTMGFFQCSNGPCIPMSGRCDRFNSCGDWSDELDCPPSLKAPNLSETENHIDTSTTKRSSLQLSSVVDSAYGIQNYAESDEGFENEEYEFNVVRYVKEIEKARKWLISQRKEDYSWGDDTERAVVALSLSKDGLDLHTQEDLLMIKQLHIRLSIALARNRTNLTPSDLALYINALQASCGDPRNFYGFDLVSKLREIVDDDRRSRKFTMPFVYATLCLNNASTHHDVQELQNVFLHRTELRNKNDIQALALLAITCLQMNENANPEYLIQIKNRLIHNIGGTLAGNVYEVALVIQAFTEAQVDQDFWNREEAIKYVLDYRDIDGSFRDVLATYYALPVLAGKSLLSLGNRCEKSLSNKLTPLEVLKNTNERIYVNYGIHFGYPMEMSQTMVFKVSPGTTFFDIMRLAQERNFSYRFSLDENTDKLIVYSIGGIPNDAERGIYWMLYVRINPPNLSIRPNLTLYDKDPKGLVPRGGEDIIFWRRPI